MTFGKCFSITEIDAMSTDEVRYVLVCHWDECTACRARLVLAARGWTL